MGTGNGNGFLIVIHNLTKQLGAGKHRNALSLSFNEFRIVLMDSSCVYYKLDARDDVFSLLTIEDFDALALKKICELGFSGVRTGDSEAL